MSEHEAVLSVIRQRNELPVPMDPMRTALLVVDVQRNLVDPGHAFGRVLERLAPGVTAGYFERVREGVIPNVQRLLGTFRTRGMPVFFTATGTRTGDGRDLPGWLRELDQLGISVLGTRVWPAVGAPSWKVDESVAPQAGEPVFIKCSGGPTASTRMEQTLRNLGVETVVVTGLTTDVGASQAACELADRGFAVVLVEDATTTLSAQMHQGALDCFNIAFGRVRSTMQVMEQLALVEPRGLVSEVMT